MGIDAAACASRQHAAARGGARPNGPKMLCIRACIPGLASCLEPFFLGFLGMLPNRHTAKLETNASTSATTRTN
jgi:hypothetical protein